MENNLVRTTNILGNNKNVVGTNTSDLVLEALGKVYIKTGKQTRILNDVFKLLDGIDGDNVGSKTIITNKIDALKFPGDGFLIFDTNENALYISYDQRYLLVIDGIDKEVKDLGFVKKEGDTMSGPLKITHQGAPLIVASKELVKRFNANYLEGHDSEYFAAKSLDEFISGYWTFQQDTKFKKNVIIDRNINVGKDSLVQGNSVVSQDLTVKGGTEVYDVAQFRNNVKIEGDVVLEGSIGSQMFMSGYQGYGWRFEADTNMLTVDYLVVRKAMHVFELVVNKISATNGSLWVTDSAKIDSVYNVKTLPVTGNYIDQIEEDVWYVPYQNTTSQYNRKKIVINESNIKRPEQYTTIDGEIVTDDTYYYYDIFKYICKYKPVSQLINGEATNIENMDKVAVLFPESDLNTGELTHFERNFGFDFPIGGEVPLYVYDNKPSFRRPISYNYYDELGNAVGNNYNKQYAYIKAKVFVEATESELNNSTNTLYRFNSVTKKYIKYESSVPEYDKYKYKYILKRDYLVKVLYTTEEFQEEATHFQPDGCDYFVEAIPTHRKNDITPTYSFNEADNTYVEVVDGNYYYDSDAQMYKEIEKYIKALPSTHYYDASTGQYKESIYQDENKPEYYLDLETNTYVKGASYIYDKNSGDYVLVKTPTHLLSNYRQAEGLTEATHVYVPQSYYAPASGTHVATHKQQEIDGVVQWITQDEYSVLDTDIQINRVLNTDTTPRVIVVDRNLKSITNSDIKQLYSLYKYFGIPTNDDVWDNETIVNLDNVKVIKMKDDEYPPFKEGDILRCQKFENGNIKFYEAVVACKIDAYSYVIIVAGSVFDLQTIIEYNEDGTVKEYKEELNKTLYSKTSQAEGSTEGTAVGKDGFDEQSLISGPAAEDGLVRIGHLYDKDRQNSVYITSSEMDSPYIQTISGVNRPDYTVLYGEPNFITNDRGYYQFSADSFKIIEGTSDMVEVNTPNGVLKLKCKDGKFYAPNNHYINESGNIVIAEYNPDSIKINTNARVRLGNLNGITDPMFANKQPYGYGLFADNVFLKGEFYLNNGNSVVEFTKDYINMQTEQSQYMYTTLFEGQQVSDWEISIKDNPKIYLEADVDFISFINGTGNTSYIYRKSIEKFNKWKFVDVSVDVKNVDGDNVFIGIYTDNALIYEEQIKGIGTKNFKYEFTEDDTENLNDKHIYLGIKTTNSNISFNLVYQQAIITQKDVIAQLKLDSDGLKTYVGDEISGVYTTLEQTEARISTTVKGLDDKVSSIEQTSDNIAMSVGKTYLFTPTISESQLNDCILLWDGETKSITTLNGTKTAYIHNANNLAGFYKKSSSKVTLKTDNTLQFEVNLYSTEVYFVLLNSQNQVISDAVCYDKSNQFVSCAATATGSGNDISFDFKISEAVPFPGYFTIKQDISDDYVYLYFVSSTNSIYFYNDRVLLDQGAIFNMTKDAISMDLESAGIYLGDGHPDPKYNGANIVLTGANTYIDSDITINANSMDITDVDGNNLKINKEQKNNTNNLPIKATTLQAYYDTGISGNKWFLAQNYKLDFGMLSGVGAGYIGSFKEAGITSLPMYHNSGLSRIKYRNDYTYSVDTLVYMSYPNGVVHSYDWYIVNDGYGPEAYLARYVCASHEILDETNDVRTYIPYTYWLQYCKNDFGSEYYYVELFGGSGRPKLYAQIEKGDGSYEYKAANSFIYYFIKSKLNDNGEVVEITHNTDLSNILPSTNMEINGKIYQDFGNVFLNNLGPDSNGSVISAICYGTHGDQPDVEEQQTIKEYQFNDGTTTTASLFTATNQTFVLFFAFNDVSNQTLKASNPKCEQSNPEQYCPQIIRHQWITKLPQSANEIATINSKLPHESVSISVTETTNCYYMLVLEGILYIDDYKLYISATFEKQLINSASKSYITPNGFHFTSPNQSYFINFDDGAFQVGSTNKWVKISDEGISVNTAKFTVPTSVISNNVCPVTITTEEEYLHEF